MSGSDMNSSLYETTSVREDNRVPSVISSSFDSGYGSSFHAYTNRTSSHLGSFANNSLFLQAGMNGSFASKQIGPGNMGVIQIEKSNYGGIKGNPIMDSMVIHKEAKEEKARMSREED